MHVDLPPPSPIEHSTRRKPTLTSKSKRKSGSNPTVSTTEVYASTRAYPSWYSASETTDTDFPRRRKSSGTGDTVLDRNICFIDTPGYGNGTSVSYKTFNFFCIFVGFAIINWLQRHKTFHSYLDWSIATAPLMTHTYRNEGFAKL